MTLTDHDRQEMLQKEESIRRCNVDAANAFRSNAQRLLKTNPTAYEEYVETGMLFSKDTRDKREEWLAHLRKESEGTDEYGTIGESLMNAPRPEDPYPIEYFFRHAPAILERFPDNYPSYKQLALTLEDDPNVCCSFLETAPLILEKAPELYDEYVRAAARMAGKPEGSSFIKNTCHILKEVPERFEAYVQMGTTIAEHGPVSDSAFFCSIPDVAYSSPELFDDYTRMAKNIAEKHGRDKMTDLVRFRNLLQRVRWENQGVALKASRLLSDKDPAEVDGFITALQYGTDQPVYGSADEMLIAYVNEPRTAGLVRELIDHDKFGDAFKSRIRRFY